MRGGVTCTHKPRRFLQDLEAIPDTLSEILKARIKVDKSLEMLKKSKDPDAQKCSGLHIYLSAVRLAPRVIWHFLNLRSLDSLQAKADNLLALHDELVEIKALHSGSAIPSSEPLT